PPRLGVQPSHCIARKEHLLLLRSRPLASPSKQQTRRLPAVAAAPPQHQSTTTRPRGGRHDDGAPSLTGAFVRLRSRARDKYIHADADASGVSLRPLGAAPSVNA
uniref:Uncharacterized protein n=1 Tax=Zea mays TaxID=4577 RepID=A0A804RQL5_MAIZE